MRLNRIFTVLNGVTLFIMIVLSVVLTMTITNINDDLNWVTHTYEAINEAENLLANMIDQETGMRGFLATGNEEYLEPYNEAVGEFEEAIESLKDTVSDNPPQVQRLEHIEGHAREWHHEAADVYLGIKYEIISGDEVEAELKAMTDSGICKEKMDEIRTMIADVEDQALGQALLIAMLNMETGVRAYVINGRDGCLEPYFQGRAVVEGYLSEAKDETLTLAVNQWITTIAERQIALTDEIRQYRNDEHLYTELSRGRGKIIMDHIREEIDRFILVEEALLIQRNQVLQRQYRISFITILSSVFLVVLVGIFQLLVTRRVTKPLDALTAQMNGFDPKDIDEDLSFADNTVYEVTQLAEGYGVLLKELKASQDELHRLTTTDQLTEVHNRRGFDESFALEWRRAIRNGHALTLLMIDIDYFKKYNDTYGHVEGDECLKKVAEVISSSLRRPFDSAARYGGEEFAVLLPETDSVGGLEIAEKIRQDVQALTILNEKEGEKGYLTVSIGIAAIQPAQTKRPQALVEHSDEALYEAKRLGRNKCVIYKG